jgi:TolA-binding protein
VSCGRVRDWLHRDVESLDDAARLVLDDHLASCARCREDREQLVGVRTLGASLAVPPAGAREYNRAIARALIEGAPRVAAPAPVRVRPRPWIPFAAFAAVAAAAVIGYVALRGRGDRAEPQAATTGSSTPQAPDVLPDVPPPEAPVVDHVARTLVLERGAAAIHAVSPDVARVVAAHFTVELDHADVTVAQAAVRVHSGRVVIAASSGAVLARLESGGTWTLPAPPPEHPSRTHPAAKRPTFAELMALARKQFAARDYDAATRTTGEALALGPRRDDEAEARTFLGDIAQASGDLAQAARRYTAVADDFAAAPTAESALYAAARVELRRGRTAAARTLLTRYLDQHPNGRYADDVRRELRSTP